LVAGAAGNISLRLSEDRFLITAAGSRFGSLSRGDIAAIDSNGRVVEEGPLPSTEYPTHLAIFSRRPDVAAIVHTHSIYASVLAFLKRPVLAMNPEAAEVVGRTPLADYRLHGTPELAQAVAEALGRDNAVLMERHGALTTGATLREALDRAIYLEEAAKMTFLAGLARQSD
jgi:L-ribulose-5-phosphate 4-epimerase